MNYYHNPIKKSGDFADPFVMQYDGVYYLYCTNPDLRCWKSTDLIHWDLCGPVISDDIFPGLVPFAPEVTYWNGKFYLYTSPSGTGHYVLESISPEGPFSPITNNLKHNIDGSVFIDDDGQWYFYWASDEGILSAKMASPTEIGSPVNTGCYLNGWTEGPFTVKRGNYYYITFTGNHYLSHGYRIHAAVSDRPQGPFKPVNNNPLIISTDDSYYGLGHSSTITGPDLYTDYIIYHNMNPDLTRDLNIAQIMMRSGTVGVYSADTAIQEIPGASEIQQKPQKIVPETSTVILGNLNSSFSGEIWLKATESSDEFEIITNDLHISIAAFDSSVSLSIKGTNIGKTTYSMLSFLNLQCFKLNLCNEVLTMHIGPVLVMKQIISFASAYQIKLIGKKGSIFLSSFRFNEAIKVKGLEYHVPFDQYYSDKNNVVLNFLSEDDKKCLLVINTSENAEYLTVNDRSIKKVNEKRFEQVITLCPGKTKYSFNCSNGTINRIIAEPIFEPKREHFEYEAISGTKKFPLSKTVFHNGKILLTGDVNSSETGTVGIIFRGNDFANGGEGNDEILGLQFYVGYCLKLTEHKAFLYKSRYEEVLVAQADVEIDLHEIQLLLEYENEKIAVYSGRNNKEILSYEDDDFEFGSVGLQLINTTINNFQCELIGE